jgi:hypothetical protein
MLQKTTNRSYKGEYMSIELWRYVKYTDEGCGLYQCLNCYKMWEGRDDPHYWNYCPHCGVEWIAQNICRSSDTPKWQWELGWHKPEKFQEMSDMEKKWRERPRRRGNRYWVIEEIMTNEEGEVIQTKNVGTQSDYYTDVLPDVIGLLRFHRTHNQSGSSFGITTTYEARIAEINNKTYFSGTFGGSPNAKNKTLVQLYKGE